MSKRLRVGVLTSAGQGSLLRPRSPRLQCFRGWDIALSLDWKKVKSMYHPLRPGTCWSLIVTCQRPGSPESFPQPVVVRRTWARHNMKNVFGEGDGMGRQVSYEMELVR